MSGRGHSEKAVRVGVVGAGWVATDRYLPALGRTRGADVVAVCSQSGADAENAAERFGVARSFERLDVFLEEPLDAVVVCTPPGTHASVVESALRADKHVLVEKPMTLTAEEGQGLQELAAERGLVLCPAHNFLFSRSAARAEKALRSGEAGDVQGAIGLQLSSPRRRLPSWYEDLPGGLFFDEAPHLLYLMRRFLGELTVEDAWHSQPTGSSDVFERREARLKGEHGEGQMSVWLGSPLSEWLLALICSRKVLVLDLFRDVLITLPGERAHDTRDVLRSAATGTWQLWKGMAETGMRRVGRRAFYGHDVLVQRFVDSVAGRERPPVGAEDGWKVVKLMEDILARSAEGVATA